MKRAQSVARHGAAAFADRLGSAGFVPDADSDVVANRVAVTFPVGFGCAYLSAQLLERPARWQVEPMFGWRIAAVDAVRARFRSDRNSAVPTIRESIFCATDRSARRSTGRSPEFRPGDDVSGSVTAWAQYVIDHWTWWSEQFADLDAIFAYLQQNIVAKFSNFETGYILALLERDSRRAAQFARLPLAHNIGYWSQETKYRSLIDSLTAVSDNLGAALISMPTFAQLADALSAVREGLWPVTDHPLLTTA